MRDRPIYLDHNATTPCDPRVIEYMIPFLSADFGNPSSKDHRYGWQAAEAVDHAREQIALLTGAKARQLTFTSGATESINLALKGIAEAKAGKGDHIITCGTEHSAVLDTCNWLEQKGYRITRLDVDANGYLSLEQLEEVINTQTICIALMYANNETGVIHPVRQIGEIARKNNVPFFCDATQAVGKISLNVDEDNIDLMAFSSHKIYGPKGAGALFIRQRDAGNISAQLHGGGHERGLRSATLNTPAIAGFGKAAELCMEEMIAESKRLMQLRDKLERSLQEQVRGVTVNGGNLRLPHVSNILVPYEDTEQLLLSLSSHLAISRGSACAGLVQQPSHVLKAMGLTDAQAGRALRISVGRFTTEQEIDEAVELLSQAINARHKAGSFI